MHCTVLKCNFPSPKVTNFRLLLVEHLRLRVKILDNKKNYQRNFIFVRGIRLGNPPLGQILFCHDTNSNLQLHKCLLEFSKLFLDSRSFTYSYITGTWIHFKKVLHGKLS